jgi:hypothetical protein
MENGLELIYSALKVNKNDVVVP